MISPASGDRRTEFETRFRSPYRIDDRFDVYVTTVDTPRTPACPGKALLRIGVTWRPRETAGPTKAPVTFDITPEDLSARNGWCRGRYRGTIDFLDHERGKPCAAERVERTRPFACPDTRRRPVGRFEFTVR